MSSAYLKTWLFRVSSWCHHAKENPLHTHYNPKNHWSSPFQPESSCGVKFHRFGDWLEWHWDLNPLKWKGCQLGKDRSKIKGIIHGSSAYIRALLGHWINGESYHLLPSTARMHVIACSLCNLHDNLLGSAHCFHPCQCKTKHGKTDQNNIHNKERSTTITSLRRGVQAQCNRATKPLGYLLLLFPQHGRIKHKDMSRYNPIFFGMVKILWCLMFWDIIVWYVFDCMTIIANHNSLDSSCIPGFPIRPWWGCPPWSLLWPNLLAASAYINDRWKVFSGVFLHW